MGGEMSTNTKRNFGTEHTIGKWTTRREAPRVTASSETRAQLAKDVYIVQGWATHDATGAGIAVTIAPATVTKKLAIRKLNSEVEGWTARSDTLPGKTSR